MMATHFGKPPQTQSMLAHVKISMEVLNVTAVHLECPDAVLIERYGGKRVDPLTGGAYSCIQS